MALGAALWLTGVVDVMVMTAIRGYDLPAKPIQGSSAMAITQQLARISVLRAKSSRGLARWNQWTARLRVDRTGADSMRKSMPWALFAMLLVSGCATTPDFDSGGTCSKENSEFCDVYDVAAASERDLRSNDAAVAVDCPMHFDMPPAAAIMPECVALVGAALVLLNNRFSEDLQPIESSAVQYSDRAGCLDTFVSGREGSDCFTAIRAGIPMKWITPARTR